MHHLRRLDFEGYGFAITSGDEGTLLTYGPEEDLGEFGVRNTVLFSVIRQQQTSMAFAVTASLLDMPIYPPFLFELDNPQAVRDLLNTHRAAADRLDFPHARIAQYLALRYLNRKTGDRLDQRDIAFLTRADFAYHDKLRVIHTYP